MSFGLGIASFGEPSPWIEQVPAFCRRNQNLDSMGIPRGRSSQDPVEGSWSFRLFGSKWPFAGVGVARSLQALVFVDGPCQAFGMVSACDFVRRACNAWSLDTIQAETLNLVCDQGAEILN